MIARPRNWDEVKETTDFVRLPVGAYVCRINYAVVQQIKDSMQLQVIFDIVEGEFAGFYTQQYDNRRNEDDKYKGVLRVWIPKDDGSDKDEITKSVFKGFVNAVEQSNGGFVWNWDERSLRNRFVGIVMRNEEYDFQGKQGWSVRPYKAISADKVRTGDYKLPNDKPLNRNDSGTFPAPGVYPSAPATAPAPAYGSAPAQPSYGGFPNYSAPSAFSALSDADGELPF